MLLIIVVFGKLFLQCRKLNIRLIPQSLNRGKAVPGGVSQYQWAVMWDVLLLEGHLMISGDLMIQRGNQTMILRL